MLFQTEKLSSFHCCKLWILLYFFVNIESIVSEQKCDPMPTPINGNVTCYGTDGSNTTETNIGTYCIFECNEDYELTNHVASFCSYNFGLRKPMWNPPSPPVCIYHGTASNYECLDPSRIDMVFVLDGSGSIQPDEFEHVKTWTKKVGDHMMKIFASHLHMGIIQFSGYTKEELELTMFLLQEEFDWAVGNITQLGGSTYTLNAMEKALEVLNAVDRTTCPMEYQKIMVLLTDGHSSGGLLNEAGKLQANGVKSFAVGVKDAYYEELRIIANDHVDRIFNVRDFEFLHEHAHNVPVEIAKTLGHACEPERTDLQHGDVSCTHKNELGSECTYTCDTGYKMKDPSKSFAFCKLHTDTTPIGGWSEELPTCIPNCEDKNGNCKKWAERAYCSKGRYSRFMSRICPKSCGKCQ